jgi:hypothetical protein
MSNSRGRPRAHALDEDRGILDAGLRQQGHELLAAVTAEAVDVAGGLAQDHRQLDEDPVARPGGRMCR